MWSPSGSQVVDLVVWPIWALGLSWLLIPGFASVCRGSQPLIWLRTHPKFQVWAPSWGFRCARPPRRFLSVLPGSRSLSGCPPTRGFRCGPQATDWGTCPLGRFGPVRPSNWATDQGVRPPGVSVVGALSADLGVHQSGFRCVLGCLSRVHSLGAEGGGAQEAIVAAESSLTSC